MLSSRPPERMSREAAGVWQASTCEAARVEEELQELAVAAGRQKIKAPRGRKIFFGAVAIGCRKSFMRISRTQQADLTEMLADKGENREGNKRRKNIQVNYG